MHLKLFYRVTLFSTVFFHHHHPPGHILEGLIPSSAYALALEVLKLVRDLVEKAAEIKQLLFSRLLSYWKRRKLPQLYRERMIYLF